MPKPHKEFIIDEVSGIKVKNIRYEDYQEGMKEVVEQVERNCESDGNNPEEFSVRRIPKKVH